MCVCVVLGTMDSDLSDVSNIFLVQIQILSNNNICESKKLDTNIHCNACIVKYGGRREFLAPVKNAELHYFHLHCAKMRVSQQLKGEMKM